MSNVPLNMPTRQFTFLLSTLTCVLIAIFSLLGAGAARTAQPTPPAPPDGIYAVRVAPGVIGVEWSERKKSEPKGYILFRAEKADGYYKEIARRPGNRPFFLDTKIEPGKIYFYKVASVNDAATPSAQTGPTCAWDNDQLAPNGSFELDSVGPIETPNCPIWWLRRAYNRQTPLIIQPGGPDGERHVEIQCSNTSVSGGLHSVLIPMIEGETWYQEAWAKALPGAKPLVGHCFHGEDRRSVEAKGLKKPHDYVPGVETRSDGWQKFAGTFTAPQGTCYVQIWLLGFQARNTLWFDGAKIVDQTAQAVRKFDLAPFKNDAAQLLRTSPSARKRSEELGKLESEINMIRQRMEAELDILSPLEYRRLFVSLDRAQRKYADLVWKLKILALLEEEVK